MSEVRVKMQIDAYPLSILLIDDHPLFCDAMALTVGEIFESPEIVVAANLTEAIEKLDDFKPRFVVLDLNLPDVEDIEGLVRLRNLLPKSKIVVVSSLSDNRVISGVIEAGAKGFVPKDSSREELIHAFQVVADGDTYTPPDFVAAAKSGVDQDSHTALNRLQSLTPQQGNILGLICQGKLNKQIAHELSIAETTVKAHLTAILRKLGVRNRTQAVLIATQARFVSPSQTDNA